ncbi:geranylgeranyl transferase type 2 subunit alpha [Eremomyces bilateralis CBS 781.70]|uniref:Geranylgeranyl transferase type-2 subunit alpha n=1 Tax=Eremomyces bilateralis CBS 781.70 TaxID=1392243 RepID=A0A6G1FTR5_9PEZI|nr:geranylgeranyl transferase type 2 subunit alpha [Eremomyces bilateralis CBS 781.70]KAF1809098.1 geranylgeranyl transferase type 2 subunit alpha [Eremomyces bilateralis CBS 781.70]
MASHDRPRVTAERTDKDLQREKRKIDEYRSLVERIETRVAEGGSEADVLDLTSDLLSRNPEYYTVWNHRRRLLLRYLEGGDTSNDASVDPNNKQASPQDYLLDDLRFLIPLLQQFPKCYWVWNYRLWILEQIERYLPRQQADSCWQRELDLVAKMLARDERNFHGWAYRRIIVDQLERLAQEAVHGEEGAGQGSRSQEEFDYTTKMIHSKLSNFSAWHYRSKLIPRILDEQEADDTARRKVLDDELDLIQNALIDPNDQSLWFYHQSLMYTIAPDCPRDSAIVLTLTNTDRVHYYEQEISRIREILEDWDDCKWVYQALLKYAAEYQTLDAGSKVYSNTDMRTWLSKLRQLDPLRSGRWDDLEKHLDLST